MLNNMQEKVEPRPEGALPAVAAQRDGIASLSKRSGDHAQLRSAAYPVGNAQLLLSGAFQMIEILPQRRRVKLRQKLRLGGGIESADFVDELTFVHGGCLLSLAKSKTARQQHSAASRIGIIFPRT